MNFKGIYFSRGAWCAQKNAKKGIAMGLGIDMERDELSGRLR